MGSLQRILTAGSVVVVWRFKPFLPELAVATVKKGRDLAPVALLSVVRGVEVELYPMGNMDDRADERPTTLEGRRRRRRKRANCR